MEWVHNVILIWIFDLTLFGKENWSINECIGFNFALCMLNAIEMQISLKEKETGSRRSAKKKVTWQGFEP